MINILEILESLTVKRVYDLDVDVLRSMTAPIIEGKEQRQIMDIFCCEKSIEEDKNGNLASFVVLAPNGFPLVFFSLRCGELFKGVSMHKMNIAHEAYLALEKLMNDRCVMQEEKDVALNKLRKAQDEGLNLDDIGNLEEKYKNNIKTIVDSIHGNPVTVDKLAENDYYITNVSKYVLGYTLGIEFASHDLIYTELINKKEQKRQ